MRKDEGQMVNAEGGTLKAQSKMLKAEGSRHNANKIKVKRGR